MGNLQASAWAAEQRARDKETCGSSQDPGTKVTYDEGRGEIVVLDDSDEEDPAPSRATAGEEPSAVAAMGQAPPGGGLARRRGPSVGVQRELEGGETSRKLPFSGGGKPGREGSGGRTIDLTLSDDECDPPASAKRATAKGGGRRNKGRETVSPWEWECPACTFRNAPFAPACDMCSTPKS